MYIKCAFGYNGYIRLTNGEKQMTTTKKPAMTIGSDLEWEKQAYGMTKAQLDQMVKLQAFPGQEMMFAAGLLSDAQHVIGTETHESNEGWVDPKSANQARQFMNCAKAIMFDYLNKQREAA